MKSRDERRADGRLAQIQRRLDMAGQSTRLVESYPENYWRRAYAHDVATLVQVIDALALQIRGHAVFDNDGKGN